MQSHTGFVRQFMTHPALVQVRCLIEVGEVLPRARLDRRVADLQNPGRWVGIALNLGHAINGLHVIRPDHVRYRAFRGGLICILARSANHT